MSQPSAGSPEQAPPPVSGRGRDRAQYGMCAFLALAGVLVLVDAVNTSSATSSNDPIGPRPVPILLGALLLIAAVVYALDVARGGTGEPEGGEDVDPTSSIDWRTVVLVAIAFGVNAVLIEPLGWVISGSILFWSTAFALGARRHLLTAAVAIALALVTFYGFAIGLGVNLPAGILQGIL